MIKGAIFDVDGTLVDSMDMWNHCGVNYLKSRGITPEPGLSEKLATFPINVTGEYLREHYHIDRSAAEITKDLNDIALDFYMNRAERKPYVTELLDALSEAGVLMITATASDSGVVRRLLRRLGLEKYFSGIYSCEELGWDKMHPECYLKCLTILDTEKRDDMGVRGYAPRRPFRAPRRTPRRRNVRPPQRGKRGDNAQLLRPLS